MIKEAIDRLLDLGPAQLLEAGGRAYTTKQVYPVLEPVPSTLKVGTLTALVDYLQSGLDAGTWEDLADGSGKKALALHVEDERTVDILSALVGGFSQRAVYVRAAGAACPFRFGQGYDVESFIVALQAMFVMTPDLEAVLKLVGNIKDEAVINYSDDGVTQAVTARTGLAKVEQVPVMNPVRLRPYRTFGELEQPESPFVFRMKQQKGEMPLCTLIEADGGRWKLAALAAAKAWLAERLPDMTIIA